MSTSSYPLPLPNDEGEKVRLNTQHELSLLYLNGALFTSPFPPSSDSADVREERKLRVADLGTGTGIWATEFAHQYPGTEVVGFDLSLPSASYNTAPGLHNVHFEVHDILLPWPSQGPAAGPFDFIHGRQVLINLRDPDLALQRAWDNLQPGGLIEMAESWNPFISELEAEGKDTSAATTPLLVEWHRQTVAATAKLGCDAAYAAKLPDTLRVLGFEDINVSDIKVPLGGWRVDGKELDERTRKIDAGLRKMFVTGVPGMTTAMFVKGLGWSKESAMEYSARVIKEFQREDLGTQRIYARVRRVRARKPMNLA